MDNASPKEISRVDIPVTVLPNIVDTEFKSISGGCPGRNKGRNMIDNKYICGVVLTWEYEVYVCKLYVSIDWIATQKAIIKTYANVDGVITSRFDIGTDVWDWDLIRQSASARNPEYMCQFKNRIPEGW